MNLRIWFCFWRRTYDVRAARLWRPVAFWPPQLASTLMRSPGLVATQTLTLLFTDIEGSTAMVRRLGAAWPGVLADHHRLIRAARDAAVAHGG